MGSSTARIAVDAMGGDLGPSVVVPGAVQAAREAGLALSLVGREDEVRAELAKLDLTGLDVGVVHAPELAGMDEKPSDILRRKKDSSIHVACRLVRDGAADGVVSAGRLEQYPGAGTYRGPDWGRGTLLRPDQFGGSVSPYAQMMHDGGDGLNSDSYVRFDAVQIKDAPAKGVQPYYSPSVDSQPYQAFVTDYSGPLAGGLGGDTPAMNPGSTYGANFAYPIVRVWYGGRMVNIARVASDTPGCDIAGNDWWHAANIRGPQVDEMSTCGPSSILP